MAKTLIITESAARQLMADHLLNESAVSDVINSSEFEKKVKSIYKDASKNDKDFKKNVEKEVKKIIADALGNTFKTMWLRKEFWVNQM